MKQFCLGFSIYRFRILIKPNATVYIPPHRAAVFYGMLADTRNPSLGITSSKRKKKDYKSNEKEKEFSKGEFPPGFILHAPDVGVVMASPEKPVAMGLTVIVPEGEDIKEKLTRFLARFTQLGRDPIDLERQCIGLYEVLDVYDCVANVSLEDYGLAVPISPDYMRAQFDRIVNIPTLTIQFLTPLRIARPIVHGGHDGHNHLDMEYFSVDLFIEGIRRRIKSLQSKSSENELSGLIATDQLLPDLYRRDRKVCGDLHWVSLSYGGVKGKTYGGVIGSVTMRELSIQDRVNLIIGQYVHTGEKINFGYGGYHIAELGVDPFRSFKSCSLLEHSIGLGQPKTIGKNFGIEESEIKRIGACFVNGDYSVRNGDRLSYQDGNGRSYNLQLASSQDLALYALLLPWLETCSSWYCKCSGNIEKFEKINLKKTEVDKVLSGKVYVVNPDFRCLFLNIERSVIRSRLLIYFPDEKIVEFLTQFLSPQEGLNGDEYYFGTRIHDIVAILFLDLFALQIQSRGGRLITCDARCYIVFFDSRQASDTCKHVNEQIDLLLESLNRVELLGTPIGKKLDIGEFYCLNTRFYRSDQWHADNRCVVQNPVCELIQGKDGSSKVKILGFSR